MIVLEILQGKATQRLHRILAQGGTATIGRAPASTIVLTDFHLSDLTKLDLIAQGRTATADYLKTFVPQKTFTPIKRPRHRT